MSFLSLTTWSLHRNLGPLRWTSWDEKNKRLYVREEEQPQTISLLELPAAVAQKGFQALEVCHFNFPQLDQEYLLQLKEAFQEANIRFYCLLIDYGDISTEDEDKLAIDLQFMKEWITIAATVGAERVRIIGGDAAPTDQQGIERAKKSLAELISFAQDYNVRVVTENFHSLTSTADNCLELIKAFPLELGLTCDFGNFKGANKYEELSKIIPYAESIHAKANSDQEGLPDAEEFKKCLDLLKPISYDGPITLVYDGPGDLWQGIERIQKIVQEYL